MDGANEKLSDVIYEVVAVCRGTHQLLAYADDVNTLGGSVHTVERSAEA